MAHEVLHGPLGSSLIMVSSPSTPQTHWRVLSLESCIPSPCLYLFPPPASTVCTWCLLRVEPPFLFLWLTASLPSEHLGFFRAEVFRLVFGIRPCCLLGGSHVLWTNRATNRGVSGEVKLWWNIQGTLLRSSPGKTRIPKGWVASATKKTDTHRRLRRRGSSFLFLGQLSFYRMNITSPLSHHILHQILFHASVNIFLSYVFPLCIHLESSRLRGLFLNVPYIVFLLQWPTFSF